MTTVAEDHVPLNSNLSAVVCRELGSEALLRDAVKLDESQRQLQQQQLQQHQSHTSRILSNFAPGEEPGLLMAAAASRNFGDTTIAALAQCRQRQLQLDHIQQLQHLHAQYPPLFQLASPPYLTPQATLLAHTIIPNRSLECAEDSNALRADPAQKSMLMLSHKRPTPHPQLDHANSEGETKKPKRDKASSEEENADDHDEVDDNDEGDDDDSSKGKRFRPYQSEQWTEKFQELCDFRKTKGHW